MNRTIGLCLTATLLCAGCAADRNARRTAADLTQAVLGYEGQVNGKVAAEKKFYHEQLATLRRTLGGNDAVTEFSKVISAAPVEKGVRTLPYMRVVTSANREARIAADEMIASGGLPSMAVMIQYIDNGVSHEREEYLAYLERQRQLTATLGENLQPIDQTKAKAADFRKALVELTKPKSTLKQSEEYAKFAKEVYDLSKSKKP